MSQIIAPVPNCSQRWKRSPARLAVLGAIALAALTAGTRLEATTVVRMDAAELSAQADLIFTGTAGEGDEGEGKYAVP